VCMYACVRVRVRVRVCVLVFAGLFYKKNLQEETCKI